jgi:quercetin dioxygenase-like cupin family protein
MPFLKKVEIQRGKTRPRGHQQISRADFSFDLLPGYLKNERSTMIELIKNAPYKDDGMGRRKLVDEKHLLLMQAALKPGQSVPQHKSDSNVHLVVLKGKVVITLNNEKVIAGEGQLIPVALGAPMEIVNNGEDNSTFLIFKTPHPAEISNIS